MYRVSGHWPSETRFFWTIKYDALSCGKCSGLCSRVITCIGLWVQNKTMSALPCEQYLQSAWYVGAKVRLMFLVWPRSGTYSRPSAFTRAWSFARSRPCVQALTRRNFDFSCSESSIGSMFDVNWTRLLSIDRGVLYNKTFSWVFGIQVGPQLTKIRCFFKLD